MEISVCKISASIPVVSKNGDSWVLSAENGLQNWVTVDKATLVDGINGLDKLSHVEPGFRKRQSVLLLHVREEVTAWTDAPPTPAAETSWSVNKNL